MFYQYAFDRLSRREFKAAFPRPAVFVECRRYTCNNDVRSSPILRPLLIYLII